MIMVAACAMASACSSGTSTSSPSPSAAARESTTSTPSGAAAPYGVGTRVETYVDPTRRTPAIGGVYPGAPTRILRVRFYYPADGQQPARAGAPFPLIVFSHGNGSVPENYAPLLSALARAGFVVAAPAYPLSNSAAPGGGQPLDLANQPRDASFVIDRVLAESRQSTWMHGLIDPRRIGAAGHSLGGMTTYALALNTCCRDARVKAAEVIDGVAAGFPAAGYFVGMDTPLLIIHGDHDTTLPYSLGQHAYASANAPKYFVTIIGGTHSGAAHGGTTADERALTAATIDFFDLYLRSDRAAQGRLGHDAQRAGVATLREDA